MPDDPIKQFHPHAAGMRSFLARLPKILSSLKIAYEAGYETALIKALRYCDQLDQEPEWVVEAKYAMLKRYVAGKPPNTKIAGKKISTLQSEFAKWFAVEEYLAESSDTTIEAAYAHVAENLNSDFVAAQSYQSIKAAHLTVRKALSDPALASKYFVEKPPASANSGSGKLVKK